MRLLLAVVSGGALSGCVVGGGENTWAFSDPASITASVSSGEIAVSSSEDSGARISWEGGGFGENAWPDVEDLDGDVVVDADGGLLGGGELDIQAPAGTPLILAVERGSVTVTLDHPASIDVCVGAGEVSLFLPEGSYDIDSRVGAGEISSGIVDEPGAEHRITACVGAGEIFIGATELEEPEELVGP